MNRTYRPAPGNSLPATIAIAVTTESIINNPVPTPNPLLPGVTTLPLLLVIPSNSILEKRIFEIGASGTITTGAASTVTAKLYAVPSAVLVAGTASTLANSTVIGTSGAVTQNSATVPFAIRATSCVFDSTSGKLSGKVESLINNTIVAAAAFSAIITGISDANDPVVGFMLTLTMSGGVGSAIVQDFYIN